MATKNQQCSYCGVTKKISDFYMSNSIIYSYNKKLPICKECLIEIFESLCNEFKSEKIALYKLCRMLDVYYSDEAYDMARKIAVTKNQGFIKIYFQKINSLNQFKDKTFENVEVGEAEVIYREDAEESEFEISTEVKKFWGGGFSDNDYIYLQNYYDSLVEVYKHDTPIQINIYKDLSINALKKSKCESATDYKKYIDIQSALMNDANIKPIQDKGDDSLSSWGLWVKKIEEEEPIPEASDEFKDVDRITNYIQKFFVNHMSRIFGFKEDDLDEEEVEVKNGDFLKKTGDNNGIT